MRVPKSSTMSQIGHVATCVFALLLAGISADCPEGEPSRPYDVMSEANPSVFDGVSAKEIREVADYLRGQGLHTDTPTVTSSYIYALDRLPPPKAEAIAFLDKGGPKPERYARVILYRGDTSPQKIEEYKVGPLSDVTSHVKISSPRWKGNIPYSLRNLFSPLEYPLVEAFIAKETAKINHILKEVTGHVFAANCTRDCLTYLPGVPGQYDIEGIRGKPWFSLLRKLEGYYEHPIGFQFRINAESNDWLEWTMDYIWFKGEVFDSPEHLKSSYESVKDDLTAEPPLRYDPEDINLYSSMHHRGDLDPPASNRRGPVTYMPDGKRYKLDGHHVRWQGWELDFAMHTVKGLRVNDIRFQGQRIAYEISIAECGVQYTGATPNPRHAAILESQFFFGIETLELVPGVDCPDYSSFFDFAHFLEFKPVIMRNSACLFEWNKAIPLRRHRENNFQGGYYFYQGMSDNVLVLRSVLTVYSYEYIIDYTFHQNGVLEVTDSLSGYVLSSYYTGKENDKYGFQVFPQGAGPMHNHVINFKVDLDVIDQKNRFETLDISIQEEDDPTEPGNKLYSQVFDRNLRETELEAALKFHFETPKYLIFHHANSSNAYGNQRGYRLLPASMTKQMLLENWRVEKSYSWGRYQVAVTKHKDEEDTSSSIHNGPNMGDPILYFQDYIDDDENIVDEDLVAWVTLGTFHIPRSEDIPIVQTPGVQLSFFLIPFNFFDGDPSLASRDNVRATPKQDGSGHNMEYAGQEPEPSCQTKSDSSAVSYNTALYSFIAVMSLAASRVR